MHALHAPMAAGAVGEAVDVERRGRDVGSRVERAAVLIFAAIDDLKKRLDVLETRLTGIGPVAL